MQHIVCECLCLRFSVQFFILAIVCSCGCGCGCGLTACKQVKQILTAYKIITATKLTGFWSKID